MYDVGAKVHDGYGQQHGVEVRAAQPEKLGKLPQSVWGFGPAEREEGKNQRRAQGS